MRARVFVDHDQDAKFERDGYVVVDGLDEYAIADLDALYRKYSASHDDDFSATVLDGDLAMRAHVSLTVREILAPVVLPLLRDYRIVLGSFAVKPGGREYGTVGLHQDLTFVDESLGTGISLWCPLVDVTEANGGLGVVPGSHRLGVEHRGPAGLPWPELYEVFEKEFLRYLRMSAGQILLMDNRVVHGSPPNHSDDTRVVAAGIAVPASSMLRYCHAEGESQTVELWDVPPDFYERHLVGTRPTEGEIVETVSASVPPLTPENLAELLPRP